jgi:hypothetical protein
MHAYTRTCVCVSVYTHMHVVIDTAHPFSLHTHTLITHTHTHQQQYHDLYIAPQVVCASRWSHVILVCDLHDVIELTVTHPAPSPSS